MELGLTMNILVMLNKSGYQSGCNIVAAPLHCSEPWLVTWCGDWCLVSSPVLGRCSHSRHTLPAQNTPTNMTIQQDLTQSGWRWQSDARFNIKPPCVGVCPPVQCVQQKPLPAVTTSSKFHWSTLQWLGRAAGAGAPSGRGGSGGATRILSRWGWRPGARCPAVSSSYRQSPSIVLSLPPDLNFWQPLIVSRSLHHHNTTESIRQTVVYKLDPYLYE